MLMKRPISLLVACATALIALAADPAWQPQVDQLIAQGQFARATQVMDKLPAATRRADAIRIDSLKTIMQRIRDDFRITPAEGTALIHEKMPEATPEQIQNWIANRKIEVMDIDGKQWWFRKAVRNLWLLGDEFKQTNEEDREQSYQTRRKYYLEAMRTPADANGVRDWRRVSFTFTLDVKADVIPAGETLRVWLPYPYENLRQRNISLDNCSHPVTHSQGSLHHTLYMEAKAVKGKPTHFEYTVSYDVGERHIAQQDLLAMLEPYDTTSALYKRYTGNEPRHVIITPDMRRRAQEIVGDETNPVLQAAAIYRWISQNFPWAGAREYSTIANMPEYVLENGHGDCGQVALLYITLVRSLGIPARWESGFMLHPDEINYHDWAETYFEGIGWVSTDVSFGRSAVGTPMESYYATGIDLYRLAANEGFGDQFNPPKTFIRSETVDSQPGEVEWRKGNLPYSKWHSDFKVNSITPLAWE